MATRRSELGAVLATALVLLAGGCDDEAAAARAEADKKHAQAEQSVQWVEQNAEDAKQFPEVMKAAAKARVLAWGDNALLERVEMAAAKARSSRNKQLEGLYAKAHEQVEAALDKKDPSESEKACTEALQRIDSLAPAVAGRCGAKMDEDRKALVERVDAAKRAQEIMAKAKELQEAESNAQARALVKSFDVVPSLKASPFEAQVLALLSKIPEKSAADSADEMVIFDGSSDAQFTYFDREHLWTWKIPKPAPGEKYEPVLLGDNTESTEDSSTIWLGDDTWGDLICDVDFNVGDGGLNFHARQKDDDTFDLIQLPQVKQGEWESVRIELRGMKAIVRLAGADKVEQDLHQAKGKFGLTLQPGALVKVRSVKLRLLDKGAHKPQEHVEQPKDDDDNPKQKKKKRPGAGGASKPDAPAGGGK